MKMRNEKELLALLKANDEKAFSDVYENYAAALYGIIYKNIPDTEKASETLCNVFIQFGKEIKQSEEFKVGIFILLYRIAIRLSFKPQS